jgi:hypothetical protein
MSPCALQIFASRIVLQLVTTMTTLILTVSRSLLVDDCVGVWALPLSWRRHAAKTAAT